jgi:hypothetical protein
VIRGIQAVSNRDVANSPAEAGQSARQSVKIVVEIQHPPTTFRGMAITPKKSANDYLFCFTRALARSRLPSG